MLLLTPASRVPAVTVSPWAMWSFSTFTVEGTVRSTVSSQTRVPEPETVALMEPVVTAADLMLLPLWAVTFRWTCLRTYRVPASTATSTSAPAATAR